MFNERWMISWKRRSFFIVWEGYRRRRERRLGKSSFESMLQGLHVATEIDFYCIVQSVRRNGETLGKKI